MHFRGIYAGAERKIPEREDFRIVSAEKRNV
jgi:hypothetical protein